MHTTTSRNRSCRYGHANFVYFRATRPRLAVVQRPLLLLALSSAMYTIALARAPLSALALSSLLALPLPSRPRPPLPVSPSPLAPRCCHQQRPLSPPLTTTISAATHSTTMTARSQRSSFVIDGGNGSHCQMRWQSMAAAAMVSLPPLSTTMIGAVGSIPPPPLSTTTVVDKDRHCRHQYRLPPHSTMIAIAAVNDDDWRRER